MAIAAPPPAPGAEVEYPDSDGRPMSDNTEQFRWIVLLKENLEAVFADREDVFVAGDLLWYPVQGQPQTRAAPDVLVAFGRPKGRRGSYRQWEEGDTPPQVVFEILSPSNGQVEMLNKLNFYERHGVEEFYVYDPERFEAGAFLRKDTGVFTSIFDLNGFVSPRLGIRFELPGGEDMRVYAPDGTRFESFTSLAASHSAAVASLNAAKAERDAAEAEREAAEARAARLAARLRALGVDPDALEVEG